MDFTRIPMDDEDGDESSNDNHNENENKYDEEFDDDEQMMDDDANEDEEDDSDEDDDDQDEEDKTKIVAEINILQDELSYNPYDYDKNILLISKFKLIGQWDYLRSAREKMNKIYPLSPKHWQEWIQDELCLLIDEDDLEKILKLYERALLEYLDIKLWQDYCQLAMGISDKIGVDHVRTIFDKALIKAGLHVTQGSTIWKLCHDFESSILEKLGQINQENKESIQKQIQRIYDLYCRQLSIPLVDMQQIFMNFEKWCQEIQKTYQIDLWKQNEKDFPKFKQKYQKSLTKLEQLNEYEQKLLNSEPPHYQQYLEYLEFEKKNDDLIRIQCLYERAVADNCLQPELWLDYLRYSDSKFVVAQILLPIYEKAVRNCYWSADIWIRYMEALERVCGTEFEPDELQRQVENLLERSLKNCSFDQYLNLWMTYLHCVRRQANKIGWTNQENVNHVRASFQQAINHLEAYQSDSDVCYEIYKYYAKVEALFCKNIDNAHNLWNQFMEKSSSLKYQANTWLDYGTFEQMYSDEEHFRSILLKGLNICNDYPECLGQMLLRFERENSSDINQYYQSMNKYEKILKKVNEHRMKQQERDNKTEKITQSGMKRKSEKNLNNDNSAAKKKKTESESNQTAQPRPALKPDEVKRDETVFVSNLSYEVDEDELQKVFAQFGEVRNVRLVRDFKGRPKGFAYVEFDTMIAVQKALQNDRMLIRQRPTFITELDKRKSFQYGNSEEKNKLFIKNIPREVTQDELLEKVFNDYKDQIVQARLVTFRNGHSKGIAYVDMKDAETAAKAVREKDGFELGQNKLMVAISDPSKSGRQTMENNHWFGDPSMKPGGSGDDKRASGSNSKSSMMVPYSVMRVKTKPSKVKLQVGTASSSQNTIPQQSPSEIKKSSIMSNEQFRSMFLK